MRGGALGGFVEAVLDVEGLPQAGLGAVPLPGLLRVAREQEEDFRPVPAVAGVAEEQVRDLQGFGDLVRVVVDPRQRRQRLAFGVAVLDVPRGEQDRLDGFAPIAPGAVEGEVGPEQPEQRHRPRQVAARRAADRGAQARLFRGQERFRGLEIRQTGVRQLGGAPQGRRQDLGGVGDPRDVPVEEPRLGLTAVFARIVGARQPFAGLAGEGVHPVAAVGPVDQVQRPEPGQRAAGGLLVGSVQGEDRFRREAGRDVRRERTEEPRGRRVEGVVRPQHRRQDRARRQFAGQQELGRARQPASSGQEFGEGPDGLRGAAGQRPHRRRVGRLGVRVAQQAAEQPGDLGFGERPHLQPESAVVGHEVAEPVPAGHDDHGVRAARQQWHDLAGIPGVVEEDQHAVVVEQGPQHPDPRARARGDRGRRDAERVEELGEHVGGIPGRSGAVAAEVGVQLPVRKPLADGVRPVQAELGLADPGGSGERDDEGRGRAADPRAHVQVVQPVDVVGAVDELADGGGQLRGRQGAQGRLGPVPVGGRGRVAGLQQLLVQVLQVLAGAGPERPREPVVDLLPVSVEGFVMPEAVQGGDPLGDVLGVQLVVDHGLVEDSQHPAVVPAFELDGAQRLVAGDAFVAVDVLPFLLHPDGPEIFDDGPAPEVHGFFEGSGRVVEAAGFPCSFAVLEQRFEARVIEIVVLGQELVAGPLGDDLRGNPGVAQGSPQPADVGVEVFPGVIGRVVPEGFGNGPDGDDFPVVEHQHAQKRPFLGPPERDLPVAEQEFDVPQDPELHRTLWLVGRDFLSRR